MANEVYKKAATKYKPKRVRVLFVAESPPHTTPSKEPQYFYFEHTTSGSLFQNIMQVLFPKEYGEFKETKNKVPLLRAFKQQGYYLIDACEYPINHHKERARAPFVLRAYPLLIRRVKKLVNRQTKIVLIKKNIFTLLAERLRTQGVNVINTVHLDFPSYGHQSKFQKKLRRLLPAMLKKTRSS